MKRLVLITTIVILIVVVHSCERESSNPIEPDLSQFSWIDYDKLRTSYDFGTYNFNVQTQLIRRTIWKRGTMTLIVDSNLNEYVELCSPILGDSVCHFGHKYSLVDSQWLAGDPSTKLYHNLDLWKVVLPDTTILFARTVTDSMTINDPTIPPLDTLLDKTLYAMITMTKRKLPSHDGINYSVDIHADINRLWIK